MKSEFALCLVIAAGLHAGVVLLGPSVQTAARLDGAMEVGLEEGDTGSTTEPALQPSPERPPPEPAAPPASPAPAPALKEEVPKPEPVREMERPTETPPKPEAPAIASEADQTPPKPVANATTAATSPPPPVTTAKTAPAPAPAPKPPAAPTRGRPGGGGPAGLVNSVRYRQRASLSYPASALRDHAGGSVLLEVLIDEEGRAAGVTVRRSSGRADLDAAAMACARQSTYEPYRVDGAPRPCRVEAPFHFEPKPGR